MKRDAERDMKLKLGLIGCPLAHSWSPEIHSYMLGDLIKPGEQIGTYFSGYSLWQLQPEELDDFFAARDFDGINVTIPYKTEVIRYLDDIDETAGRVGAVNCIVDRGGRLTGYNTDAAGLELSAGRNGINPKGGPAVILGSGGAGRAAEELCRQRGWDYRLVSRDPGRAAAERGTAGSGLFISYEEMYSAHDRWSLLINATPVGMHPRADDVPVDISRLDGLDSVIDIVANPVRSRLVFEAQQRGLRACGGLEMLVAQALISDELFTGRSMDTRLIDACIRELLRGKRSIVLIGMPGAGKSTIAELLARSLDMQAVDMDSEIERQMGMPVADIFGRFGETAFRDAETRLCADLQSRGGCIISTGGGVVKREENMRRLAHNGVIVWLDRDPGLLEATESRPLSSSAADIGRLYAERRQLYERYCDVHIANNGTAAEAAAAIADSLNRRSDI